MKRPEMGDVLFDGQNVNYVDPPKRNVAMVFENYALYPHITVYKNIAFPLRGPLYKGKITEAEIDARVHKVATIMNIDHLLERMPAHLSNGQRQRVALGRALVREPNVFLLDDPLAHLGAKLRNLMRTELKALQKDLYTTTIYVTHDFMEAMSLGDTIAILNHGKLEQVGTRDDVYYRPVNEFVAKMFGEPEINMLEATLSSAENKTVSIALDKNYEYKLSDKLFSELKAYMDKNDCSGFHLGIRAGNIRYSYQKGSPYLVEGKLYATEPMGNRTVLVIQMGEHFLRCFSPNDFNFRLDENIYLDLDIGSSILFDEKSLNLIASSY